MLKSMLRSVWPSTQERALRRLEPLMEEVLQAEVRLAERKVQDLAQETARFRVRIEEEVRSFQEHVEALIREREAARTPEERQEIAARLATAEEALEQRTREVLDEILPEAFAVHREACRRLMGTSYSVMGHEEAWNMVPYDVQILGGIVLHQGKVAEMATGEGKTLVATLPLYLNALAGRGAHLVTVNAYLARRDSEVMAPLYQSLGLTVDCIDLYPPAGALRRQAYAADITYGTNQEFGFDYLRDNMAGSREAQVQRGHFYAIVDEADSVLIDEARTPLLISGPAQGESGSVFERHRDAVAELYRQQVEIVDGLLEKGLEYQRAGRAQEAAEQFMIARRGSPRHPRLIQMFSAEPPLRDRVDAVEKMARRDRVLTQMEEATLLFALDERGNEVHLTERGLALLSGENPDTFVIPDLSSEYGRLEQDGALGAEERQQARKTLEEGYAEAHERVHVIHALLQAYALYHRDEHYIVQGDSVSIVDEFTGRTMSGRRWSDGLHQAVEAKEGVPVQGETQTLATISLQNYFRLYARLAGMTGTAVTEAGEFDEIYRLEVVRVPTNRPVIRRDHPDRVYRTQREKLQAVLDHVEHLHGMGLPVLIGTSSVEHSEQLSRLLSARSLQHQVLNAKQNEREAEIVARAGEPGAITVATNMAGRGTDIRLGAGVAEVREGGWAGLQIVGTERHESRRIDQQLRGRAGRQGDPGDSLFFLSLEDDLMRLFGSEGISRLMGHLGFQEGDAITHPLVNRLVTSAQKKVEGQNFLIRKKLLDYDDVMNRQREIAYGLRDLALEGGSDLEDEVRSMLERTLRRLGESHVSRGPHPEDWRLPELRRQILSEFGLDLSRLPQEEGESVADKTSAEIFDYLARGAGVLFQNRLDTWGEFAENALRFALLQVVDEEWKEHLYVMDHLRQSVQLRTWGQKDPLVEYKEEAFSLFEEMMRHLEHRISQLLWQINVQATPEEEGEPAPGGSQDPLRGEGEEA